MTGGVKPVRVPDLKAMKGRGEKISVLTAYDANMARLLDGAGVDVLLVGDSVGMVLLGYETTLPVTLEAMIHHARAVSRGTRRALVIVDMPFLTYQVSVEDAMRNAGRLVQEGGAAGVKIEGGRAVAETTRRLTEMGIPVMGHLGLTPQSVHQMGGFRPQARSQEEQERLLDHARVLEEVGAFAIVLESIPAETARAITAAVGIPTIGIGAGPACDGQVLVSYDALGMFVDFVPPFAKQYARLAEVITEATRHYVEEVRSGRFPGAEHTLDAVLRPPPAKGIR